ncbi:MAG: dTDP-4-dehydrorhamnose reductase, partial [Candidatus Neomarinimicrobiota bacterium]
MKTAIIGANGQLGSAISDYFSQNHVVIKLTHEDIEISDIDNVRDVLKSSKVELVINTAAYHNVPKCEENPAVAYSVNAVGSLNLARIIHELDIPLLHYSTDYVFDGSKLSPYHEDDETHPLNVYAESKLSGENLIRNYCQRYFIIRVSGLYGRTVCRAKGGNFITTMMKAAREKPEVRVVTDEILTPTPVTEIAMNSFYLAETDAYGLYHMTSQGECSWYEFAEVIFDELGLSTPLKEALTDDFPQAVNRPTYSVLENRNLKSIDRDKMSPWKTS